MKGFSNQKIEKSLRTSLSKMTSKNMNPIKEINLRGEYRMKRNFKLRPLLAPVLAVFIALIIFGNDYYSKNIEVKSNISLDVNPSIVISTNYYNEVIKVKALNEAGEEILMDINVNGLKAEEATNIIIDELIARGYLEGDGANILVTVQNNDIAKAKEIEATLLTSVNKKLDDEYIAGTVMTQVATIRTNIQEEVLNLMNNYNISFSKATFITNILAKDTTLVPEDLANLKISEISKLLNDNNIDIKDVVGYNGEDSMYESATVTRARKVADEAEQVKIQAQTNAQNALEELQTQTQNQQNLEKAQKAYEQAEQTRLQAEQEALEAQRKYEEAEANKYQGNSTQNKEPIENESSTNGEQDSTTDSSNTINGNGGSTTGNRP